MGNDQSTHMEPSPVVFTLYYVPYDPSCVRRVREWMTLGPRYNRARFRTINVLDHPSKVTADRLKYPYITRRDTSGVPVEEFVHEGCTSNEALKRYIDEKHPQEKQ